MQWWIYVLFGPDWTSNPGWDEEWQAKIAAEKDLFVLGKFSSARLELSEHLFSLHKSPGNCKVTVGFSSMQNLMNKDQ